MHVGTRKNTSLLWAVWGLFLLAALAAAPHFAFASGRASLSIAASPDVILADGKSLTTLSATVRDGGGSLVADGTSVQFVTSLGTLDRDSVTTVSGVARIVLTSAASEGTATVTATAFVAGAGASSTGACEVLFTGDRNAVFGNGQANWIHVDCPQYLVYSANDKVIEAQGRHGTARLQYRTLDVTADALQVSLITKTLLARNAVLQRGHHIVRAAQLRYDLDSEKGLAVVLGTGKGERAHSVTLTGYALDTAPLDAEVALSDMEDNQYKFADLSESRVVISARGIAANPGDQIQFRRASIYADGKKVLSLPFHVMPMNSDALLGRQWMGFGSLGFFLNVPYYYHVSPHSIGTLYLRNSAVQGADFNGETPPLVTGTRPGLSLDLEHTYDFGRAGVGAFVVDGLTRSEWGAHWNHTQRFNDATSGYFFVDYPSHRSLYASSTLSHALPGYSLNLTSTYLRDPGYGGYSSTGENLHVSVQSFAHPLGNSAVNYVYSGTVQAGNIVQTSPGVNQQTVHILTPGVDVRLFTAPLHPDKATQITNSLTIGGNWDAIAHRPSALVVGTLGATRAMPLNGSLIANYTFRYDPLFTQADTPGSGNSNIAAILHRPTQQHLFLSYAMAPSPKFSFSLSGSYGLPLGDNSLFGNMSYRVNRDWGLGLGVYEDRYGSYRFRDTELSVIRRIFGRDFLFAYSTQTKKVRFDLAATTFR